jgi:hypothetical protein
MLFTIIFLEKSNYLYSWAFYGAQSHVLHVINARLRPVTQINRPILCQILYLVL